MNFTQSELWHERASRVIIGGVNSPSRSFKAVGGGSPITIESAKGAYLYDVDGNPYIDYLAAYGPIIAGHAHPHIVDTVHQAMQQGSLIGAPTPWETLFAERLQHAIPELERIRFVNSGTEAVMTLVRVARAYTGKTKIMKFAGCYHGHFDQVLVAAGSGPSSLGTPDSAGVPEAVANAVVTVPFNDIQAFQNAWNQHKNDLAGVMIEPVVGNFGIVTPIPGFLETIRQATAAMDVPLIYDEVITAFRFRFGIVNYNEVKPDLIALGKIIGGGLPIGAYGGKQKIMEQVAPLGPAYQAGTLAGNPASIRAGMACLDVLEQPGVYERMNSLGQALEEGLLDLAQQAGVPITINRLGGGFTVFFGDQQIVNYEDAKQTDAKAFAVFFKAMLANGVHLAPSKYEAWFLTAAHTEQEVEKTLAAAKISFEHLKNQQK
jgi:glutamate-1-semialdehyde 2,1-aminomutase